MPRIVEEIAIEAPAERVFNACASPDMLLNCHPGVRTVTQDGMSEQRIGDSFLAHYSVLGSRYNQRFMYTRYQSPTEISLQFEGLTVGRMDFSLAPTANGTHLRLSVDYQAPGGPIARAVNRLVFQRMNEKNAERMLTNLKRLVEGAAH